MASPEVTKVSFPLSSGMVSSLLHLRVVFVDMIVYLPGAVYYGYVFHHNRYSTSNKLTAFSRTMAIANFANILTFYVRLLLLQPLISLI